MIWHSMQIISTRDGFHEMSDNVYWKNKNIINLSSAEFAWRVVKVKQIHVSFLFLYQKH